MGPCTYCTSPTGGQVEHTYPRCRGGAGTADNTVHACSDCNLEKGDRTVDEWAGDRVRVGLSWPPPSRAEVIDELVKATPVWAMDYLSSRLPDERVKAAVRSVYRSARTNPYFTYEAGVQVLLDAAEWTPAALSPLDAAAASQPTPSARAG